MDYRNYKDLDFVVDDYFIRWVHFPNEYSNHFWAQWLKDHPHKEEDVNRAKRILLSINVKPAKWGQKRQVKLKQKVMQLVNENNNTKGRKAKLPIRISRLSIAATFLGFLLLFGVLAHVGFSDNVVYYTADNETKEVLLPDGSVVKMNNNTKLSYTKHWWSSKRNAVLEGEAFFKIKHDDNSLFTTYYGKLHAKVLGTSFNIKAYPGLEEARLTVVTGKVEVGEKDKSFGLFTPNKEIVYNTQQQINVTRVVNAKKISEWNNKEINLFDVPFSELVFTLEQVYNVKVKYPEEKLKHTLTTIHFQKKDDLMEVLKVIGTIHQLEYSLMAKNELIFKSRR